MPSPAGAATVEEIRARGVLVHLGIPYGNFVTGSGDGLDIELMARFARHLGVRHSFRQVAPDRLVIALTGRKPNDNGPPRQPPEGDLAAGGITILPERQKHVLFSQPTFPTQVWVLARHDSPLTPVRPGGNVDADIAAVIEQLTGRSVLGFPDSALSPKHFGLDRKGVLCRSFTGNINELVPAVIRGEADATLLDLPLATAVLEDWSGKVKIIGPLSPPQRIGVAFAPESRKLCASFNAFFRRLWSTGEYADLVRQYYPGILEWHRDFFEQIPAAGAPRTVLDQRPE